MIANNSGSVTDIKAGNTIDLLTKGPISRTTLALFAGASSDHSPLHIDIDFVREAGMPDVFAHGMLVMAYAGQMLTRWASQERLRRWTVRFVEITPVNAVVTCTGRIVDIVEVDNERQAELAIAVTTDDGRTTLTGTAIISLS